MRLLAIACMAVVLLATPIWASDTVCDEIRMSDKDWAACDTKSWRFSSKDGKIWSERFFTQQVKVCRPKGHANLGYKAKSGIHYIVRFQ